MREPYNKSASKGHSSRMKGIVALVSANGISISQLMKIDALVNVFKGLTIIKQTIDVLVNAILVNIPPKGVIVVLNLVRRILVLFSEKFIVRLLM